MQGFINQTKKCRQTVRMIVYVIIGKFGKTAVVAKFYRKNVAAAWQHCSALGWRGCLACLFMTATPCTVQFLNNFISLLDLIERNISQSHA